MGLRAPGESCAWAGLVVGFSQWAAALVPRRGGLRDPRRPPECVRGAHGACARYVLGAELGPSLTDPQTYSPMAFPHPLETSLKPF